MECNKNFPASLISTLVEHIQKRLEKKIIRKAVYGVR